MHKMGTQPVIHTGMPVLTKTYFRDVNGYFRSREDRLPCLTPQQFRDTSLESFYEWRQHMRNLLIDPDEYLESIPSPQGNFLWPAEPLRPHPSKEELKQLIELGSEAIRIEQQASTMPKFLR